MILWQSKEDRIKVTVFLINCVELHLPFWPVPCILVPDSYNAHTMVRKVQSVHLSYYQEQSSRTSYQRQP